MDYRVFVSSTTGDLAGLRSVVCEGVRRYFQTPVSMESMEREGASAVPACLEAVDGCDLYLGLIAANYGTIPAEGNPAQLSFTELEYRRAYQSGKEVHWFVRNLDRPANEERASAFRKEIEERHNPGHFSTEKDLTKLVDKVLFDWSRRKNLEKELTARYCTRPGQHRFKVVPSVENSQDAAVVSASAREFVSYIIENTKQRVANNNADEFVVGVSGGNAQKQIVEFIEQNWNTLIGGGRNFGAARLTFLALNSASLPDRFTHTANFLTGRLSQLFPGSHQFARLRVVGAAHQSSYEAHFKAIKVILGGAAESDGFLTDWFRSLTPTNQLPAQFFGDFCYVPVDRLGQAIPSSVLQQIEGSSALDIHSGFTFEHLRDVRTPVILPLSKSRRLGPVMNALFTKKGRIGDLVLRHISNCICVLDEYTASRLLSRSLCGYRLRDDVEPVYDARGYLYQAVADAGPGGAEQHLCIVHQDARLPRAGAHSGRHIDEILISDPPGPKGGMQCNLLVEGKPFRIDAAVNVRRPGLWSTTLVRSGLRLLREAQTAVPPRVLDMGCGSGVVGSLIASLWTCDEVVFADIEEAALDCARDNVQRLRADPHCGIAASTRFQYVRGNLFEKLDPSRPFDLALFCPPFLPSWGLPPDAELHRWDSNGASGLETAIAFAKVVSGHLQPGGVAIISIAGYVDYKRIEIELSAHGLLLDRKYRPRRVLYPYFPSEGWPVASEILHRAQLENRVPRSTFRDEYWKSPEMDEPAHYLAFDMMHIVASKPRVKDGRPGRR